MSDFFLVFMFISSNFSASSPEGLPATVGGRIFRLWCVYGAPLLQNIALLNRHKRPILHFEDDSAAVESTNRVPLPRRNIQRINWTASRKLICSHDLSFRRIILLHRTSTQHNYSFRRLLMPVNWHHRPWFYCIQHSLRGIRIRISQIKIHP